MADATGASPLLPGLPPKPLLRCRAVSPAWRRATSTSDFLLSHHARQPALPLFYSRSNLADGGVSLDVIPFDHRAAGVAAADRFQSAARLKRRPLYQGLAYVNPYLYLEVSRDGLLLLSNESDDLYIFNPATGQYAPLRRAAGFRLLDMYPHPPTGEYRLLIYHEWGEDQDAIYVFTIGSGQPPRHIGCPDLDGVDDSNGLLFQGSIYWYTSNGIVVFDTTTESFRRIRAPVDRPYARLFEMGDMLAIFCPNDEETSIDISVMKQNHQGEVWDFKCRVELPVAETRQKCQCCHRDQDVMLVPGDRGLLILLRCDGWLFQVDIHGKLIASFNPRGIISTCHVLKQTLVQHTFFPTLEGYVVNAPPFI